MTSSWAWLKNSGEMAWMAMLWFVTRPSTW